MILTRLIEFDDSWYTSEYIFCLKCSWSGGSIFFCSCGLRQQNHVTKVKVWKTATFVYFVEWKVAVLQTFSLTTRLKKTFSLLHAQRKSCFGRRGGHRHLTDGFKSIKDPYSLYFTTFTCRAKQTTKINPTICVFVSNYRNSMNYRLFIFNV